MDLAKALCKLPGSVTCPGMRSMVSEVDNNSLEMVIVTFFSLVMVQTTSMRSKKVMKTNENQ